MKIRLHGTEAECKDTTERMMAFLNVVSVSDPYPDRAASTLVRVYVEVRPAVSATERPVRVL